MNVACFVAELNVLRLHFNSALFALVCSLRAHLSVSNPRASVPGSEMAGFDAENFCLFDSRSLWISELQFLAAKWPVSLLRNSSLDSRAHWIIELKLMHRKRALFSML